MKRVFISGSAGFIGFHLAKKFLDNNAVVMGYDGFTDYYNVALKNDRNSILEGYPNYVMVRGKLENYSLLHKSIVDFEPDCIIHLAAQAGVRYSLENPRSYIESNVIGSFNISEIAKEIKVKHLMAASTSSVYGANKKMPFFENDKTDTPLTIYAATKKSNEIMAHSYSYLWRIPTTMMRFFTVYGTWGRPDLALYKFVESILDDKPIDVYNNGNMFRDFTYVDDLVTSIVLLSDVIPSCDNESNNISCEDSLSDIAPYRVVNIGNSQKVKLLDFIEAIELALGKKAIKNYMPMQLGDVPATLANTSLLNNLTNSVPKTDIKDGIAEFIKWYRSYYNR